MAEGIVSVEKTKPRGDGTVAKQFRWALRRPMNLEKLALLAQRLSGVGLLVYLFFHIFVTSSVVSGEQVWAGIMDLLFNPLAHIGELLVVVGATFHGINGIRVMLLELTSLAGKPLRPDYPYKVQSLGKRQQSILYTATIMAGLSTIAGIIILWGLQL
jgi:succinate dehydrogenase cytochrome b556 subunit